MSDFKHLPRSNVLFGPLRRTLAVLIVGVGILATSCFAEFRSLNWLYDTNSGAIYGLSCPKLGLNMKRSDFTNQGDYCEVKVYGWDLEARARLNDGGYVQKEYSCEVPRFDMKGDNWEEFTIFRDKNPIVCRVKSKCSQVRQCSVENGGTDSPMDCPRGSAEAMAVPNPQSSRLWVFLGGSGPDGPVAILIKWIKYQDTIFTEFCDQQFTVPVAKMVAVRGIAASVALIVALWLVTDIILHMAYQRYSRSNTSKNLDEVEQEFNDNLFAHLWGRFTPQPVSTRAVSVTTPRSGRDGMVSRLITAASPRESSGMGTPRSVGGTGPVTPRSFKVAVCKDPSLAFTSANWCLKVGDFVQRRIRQRGLSKELIFRSIFYPFFAIVFGTLIGWAFLAASPRNLLEMHSVFDTVTDDYSTIWRATATWIILPFLLLDELTDLLVFFLTSSVTRFAKPAVIAKFHQDYKEDVSDDGSLSGISSPSSLKVCEDDLVPQSVIGVVCVDTLRLADEDKLVDNVNSMISIVGIEKLFILHFSDSLSPLDDTVVLLQRRIHPAIQYVYVPERDKLAAVYWFSKYYVPLFQLHQQQVVSITHVLIADQNVWIPQSLTIPHSLLDSEVGLVCFAPSFKRTSRFTDVDLKFDIAESIFQSDRASMGDSETGGALLTLWDRQSLEVATFDHVPLTEANGGDFAGAGINVVRQPGLKIKFISNAFIKLNGSESDTAFSSLFAAARRRRLVFTDFTSLLSPSSIMNTNRLSSKPANIVRLLRFLWDLIRLPVLLSTVMRDPIGLGLIIVFFLLLQWVRLTVLSIVIIPSAVRKERPSISTQILYPFMYFFYDLVVLRPLAIVAALLWAVNDRPGQCIHEREDYEKDIPPCLPYPDAPWYSAWVPLDNPYR